MVNEGQLLNDAFQRDMTLICNLDVVLENQTLKLSHLPKRTNFELASWTLRALWYSLALSEALWSSLEHYGAPQYLTGKVSPRKFEFSRISFSVFLPNLAFAGNDLVSEIVI